MFLVESDKPDIKDTNYMVFYIQRTLVILKSKGPSETLRDIRSSTYQFLQN